MAKISYYLDTRPKRPEAGAKYPIKIRVHAKNQANFIDTGIRVSPDRWNADASVVTGSLAAKLNTRLSQISARIDDTLFAARMAGKLGKMTSLEIASMIRVALGEEPREVRKAGISVLEKIEEYRDKQSKPGTWEVYNRTAKALLAFDPDARKIGFAEMDRNYLERFEAHCLRSMKRNSVAILLRNIRTVFNRAIDDEITEAYPFRKFRIRTEETRKRSLTVEQLRELFASEVTWEREYLDMFRLMFYLIGINAVDLFSARPSDLEGGRLHYRRAKTGRRYSVKVEPEAMEIIDRYRGKDYLLSPLDRYASPADYLAHLNRGIKAIGRVEGKRGKVLEPGKWKAVTTYWARHSWASIAYGIGIPVDVIGQALGHSDRGHSVTMIYIRQDAGLVDEANRRVMDFVPGK